MPSSCCRVLLSVIITVLCSTTIATMTSLVGQFISDLVFDPPSHLHAFEAHLAAPAVTAVGVVDGEMSGSSVRVFYPACKSRGWLPVVRAKWLPIRTRMAKAVRLAQRSLDVSVLSRLVLRIICWILSLIPTIFLIGLPDTYNEAEPVAYKHARYPILVWLPEYGGLAEENSLLLAEIAASVPAIVLVVEAKADRELTSSRQGRLERVITELTSKQAGSVGLFARVLQSADMTLFCLGGAGLGGATVLNYLSDHREGRHVACSVIIDGHAFAPSTDSDRYPPTLLMSSTEMQADRKAAAAIRFVPGARLLTSRNTLRTDLTELCFWTPRLIGGLLLRLLHLSHPDQKDAREAYNETVRWVTAFVQANTVTSVSSCEDSDIQQR